MASRKITKLHVRISPGDRYSHDSEQAEVTPNRLHGRPPESRNFVVRSSELSLAPAEQHKRARVHRFFLLKSASSLKIFFVSSMFR